VQIRNPFLIVQKQISATSGFLLILLSGAAFNFAQSFYENFKAASASGTRTFSDGMEISICYFGPPIGFYPRLLVFIFLLVACVSSFTKEARGRIITFLGAAGALSAYLYWWIASHKAFKSLGSFEIDFMNSTEVTQVAYLYNGNWLDVCLAVSVFTVLVLQVKSLATKKFKLA